jgi:hypothetical protein
VEFPSGAVVEGLGPEARCMQCHQGRESTVSVNERIDGVNGGAGPVDDDTPTDGLGFRNVHYLPAGATLYGRVAMGGYQYAGNFYDGRFRHVAAYDACINCHDQHSLEVRVDRCGRCHEGVATKADLHNIRMTGSIPDYDADGNTTEGIAGELETMAEILYGAIRQYAKNALGTAIVYDGTSYPYFFADLNDNGIHDAADAGYPSTGWSARLVRATYNYQYWNKDPGAFAHNAKYVMELLYDSIADLNSHPTVDVPEFDELVRVDSGHFDPSAEPFRHWDGDGEVSSSCARCHSVEGFEFHVEYGIDITKGTEPVDGFNCEMCHVQNASFAEDAELKYVDEVTFPSDLTIENDPDDPDPSFLCMTCHQGRESKATVDARIAQVMAGEATFGFRNIHYLAGGATLYGHQAMVGYEYTDKGKTYSGKWNHFSSTPTGSSQCVFCHLGDHSFLPKLREDKNCEACHTEAKGEIENIRLVSSRAATRTGTATAAPRSR